ncbi:DUF7551 domain-containing protein [Halovivax limisalsi]|uniref:DUF7551 domain-containing protein n=1 Tax=Halovivax limisalsi TaxID=1453760 RepID=UPI001FFD5A71|nr:hypothetical protein [Halovivax limisalsi]
MVGVTLAEIRAHIESLASDDGDYYVVCGRTGDRPVPAAGHRFPDRATARAAARATGQYRSALRRYDPQVPYYDLIVCEVPSRSTSARSRESAGDPSHRQPAGFVLAGDNTTERCDLVEFCHRAAGAVFETLSEAGYGAVERAVMDTYFDLAETVGDPDELCLCLLESTAAELAARLSLDAQADVLTGAAARLEPIEADSASPGARATDPLETTLAALDRRGLVGSYARSPWSVDRDGTVRSSTVGLSRYALSPQDGCLPVLPITLELARQGSGRLLRSVAVTAVGDGWHLEIRLGGAEPHGELVNAPIEEDG